MDDLTKSAVMNSKPLNQAKQDKWLNKDRFWNLVFWFGMSGGLAVAHFLRTNLRMIDLATFMYFSTFFGIPLLLIIFNRSRFIKKDTFFNSEGTVISNKQMPYAFPLAIPAGIGFAMWISEFLPKNTNSLFVAFTLSISMFSGVSLYFIFKNCPISILFNYKFWNNFEPHPGITVASSSDHYRKHSSSSSRSSLDYFTNPIYGGLSSNIYNKYR